MKVQTLKAHYYNREYKTVGSIYDCDKGDVFIKLGLVKTLEPVKEKKERKPRRTKKER
jgi:hypothetical protein